MARLGKACSPLVHPPEVTPVSCTIRQMNNPSDETRGPERTISDVLAGRSQPARDSPQIFLHPAFAGGCQGT
jgi:hypothetical protein